MLKRLLDMTYEIEYERTSKATQIFANIFNHRVQWLPEQSALLIDGEALTAQSHQLVDYTNTSSMSGTALMVRKGNGFIYIGGYLNGKDLNIAGQAVSPILGAVDPVQDLLNGKSVISIANHDGNYSMIGYAPIVDSADKVVGAVGVRISLDDSGLKILRREIHSIKVGETGYAYALAPIPGSDEIRFSLHPTLDGKKSSTLPDHASKVAHQVVAKKNGFLEYLWPNKNGGQEERMTYVLHCPEWDWYVATTVPYEEYLGTAFKMRNLLIGISLLSGLITIIILFFAIRNRMASLAPLVDALSEIEAGNLKIKLPETSANSKNEVGILSHRLNQTILSIRQLIGSIAHSATTLNESANHQQNSATNITTASESQNEAANSVASAVEELSTSIAQVADNADQASEAANSAREASTNGQTMVHETVASMQTLSHKLNENAESIIALGEQSSQIASIVDVIKAIADQTNLLALNAAIEAARAGEQGRGFAVVADEVRKLAERTGQSTQEIADMINTIVNGTGSASEQMQALRTQMGEGVEKINQIEKNLAVIDERNIHVTRVVQDIADATRDQSSASGEISRQIEAISQMAESNTEIARNNLGAVGQMMNMAQDLQQQVARFRT